ncbi:MAG: hypothetical protein IT320_03195 [Anaerolineae bacterium]|nr:hypothetical protein [Anaerolineae bacterium]
MFGNDYTQMLYSQQHQRALLRGAERDRLVQIAMGERVAPRPRLRLAWGALFATVRAGAAVKPVTPATEWCCTPACC